nr:TetR/AcrR family transcriptional regulator [Mesorhizobium sp. NBSH29]
MQVFWAKGYEGTSLTDLTVAMGINAPSLYAAFRSKEALFLEATQLYSSSEGSCIFSALLEGETARAAIVGFLTESAKSYSQPDKPKGCMVTLGALHVDPSSTLVCTDLRRRRSENLAALERRIAQGIEAGDVPATADAKSVAAFYQAVQHGMSIQANDGASGAHLMQTVAGAMYAWEGLTAGDLKS